MNQALMTTVDPGTRMVSGYPRDYLENEFVYLSLSPAAKGFVAGIDLHRATNGGAVAGGIEAASAEVVRVELGRTVHFALDFGLASLAGYHQLPAELLQFQGVTIEGDSETAPYENFCEILETVVHLRAVSATPFFKIAITIHRGDLHWARVEQALKLLVSADEILVRIPGGTEDYVNKILHWNFSFDQLFSNILPLARKRAIIVQTLLLSPRGQSFPPEEIEAYLARIASFQNQGAIIQSVQFLSAVPSSELACLPLPMLSQIARSVREATKLPVRIL
jgi:hypothetical protein